MCVYCVTGINFSTNVNWFHFMMSADNFFPVMIWQKAARPKTKLVSVDTCSLLTLNGIKSPIPVVDSPGAVWTMQTILWMLCRHRASPSSSVQPLLRDEITYHRSWVTAFLWFLIRTLVINTTLPTRSHTKHLWSIKPWKQKLLLSSPSTVL